MPRSIRLSVALPTVLLIAGLVGCGSGALPPPAQRLPGKWHGEMIVYEEEVAGKLAPQEQSQLTQVRPLNSDAYEAYLRGRYFVNIPSDDALQRAKENFEQAIHKDPNYAPAYAGLAVTYNMMTFSVALTMGPDDGAPKAIEAANKLTPASAASESTPTDPVSR